MGQIHSLDDLTGFLRRRLLLIVLIAASGIGASLFLAASQPRLYEAAAVIQIETPVVEGEAASRTAQGLQAIEQRVLTRANLLELIQRHALFADLPLSDDRKVALLREAIRFQSVASVAQQAMGQSGISALVVTAGLAAPDQAAAVANDLADRVLALSTEGQAQRIRETMRFFLDEESRIGTDIHALEAEIARFQNANPAAVTTLREGMQDEALELDAEMRLLDQSLARLAGERAGLNPGRMLSGTERQALDSVTAELAVTSTQRAALATRRAEIAARLAQVPDLARQSAEFDRRRGLLQDRYDSVSRRLAEADTSQRLEDRDQGERLHLLEGALAPEQPSGGRARKIAALGVILSLGAAFGAALMLEMANPVLRTSAQMQRQLGILPVAAIPHQRRRRIASPQL